MAICGSCGAETSRVRIRFEGTLQKPDECPHCAPETFEKFRSVRDGQITMAWEYDHKKYRLVNGLPQITDEGLADLEAAATKQSEEDKLAYEKAVEKKRHERRTAPMSAAEISSTIEHVRNVIESGKSSAAY